MELYIVRHAFAGQHGDPQYPDDALRPLTVEGRHDFKRFVKKLARRDFAPQTIATSPLVRCRQTAEVIAKAVGDCAQPVELAELAPGSELGALLAWTRGQRAQRIAWVGHSPDVERLTASLVGDCHAGIHFGKGTIASVEFGPLEELAVGRGELRWLATLKLLGC